MDRGASRLGRVIDDLLLLSKVGDPNNPIIPVPVDLRRVVDEVLDLSSVAAQRKALDHPRRGARRAGRWPLGDPEELDRVCANLVSNAVKYTPDGALDHGVAWPARTTRSCCAAPTRASASPQADQQHLFSEFFRSTNPEAVAEPGTGLGLTIVQRIVERHGGRIEVASELGQGSTFTVRLPAAA